MDGSHASLDALRWAAGLAHATGGEVTAVNSFTPGDAELAPEPSNWCTTPALLS
ncbi:MAG: universal stress protein [Actinomycetota bacterium]|nr:universal stress protein [Actinomycetota bacterium]